MVYQFDCHQRIVKGCFGSVSCPDISEELLKDLGALGLGIDEQHSSKTVFFPDFCHGPSIPFRRLQRATREERYLGSEVPILTTFPKNIENEVRAYDIRAKEGGSQVEIFLRNPVFGNDRTLFGITGEISGLENGVRGNGPERILAIANAVSGIYQRKLKAEQVKMELYPLVIQDMDHGEPRYSC